LSLNDTAGEGGDRVFGGRGQGFAGADVEERAVQRALDRPAFDPATVQRELLMAADVARGEILTIEIEERDGLVSNPHLDRAIERHVTDLRDGRPAHHQSSP